MKAERCVNGDTNGDGLIELSELAYRLAPHQGRRFRIVELEGFVVELRGEGTIAATIDATGLA